MNKNSHPEILDVNTVLGNKRSKGAWNYERMGKRVKEDRFWGQCRQYGTQYIKWSQEEEELWYLGCQVKHLEANTDKTNVHVSNKVTKSFHNVLKFKYPEILNSNKQKWASCWNWKKNKFWKCMLLFSLKCYHSVSGVVKPCCLVDCYHFSSKRWWSYNTYILQYHQNQSCFIITSYKVLCCKFTQHVLAIIPSSRITIINTEAIKFM